MSPLITIITVSYNAVSTIEETIMSVINQSYHNIEYIIIDGGSTDGTIDIIEKYQNLITYWKSESDNGIYDAMNKAIQYSIGDFLYFLGADDVLAENIPFDTFEMKLNTLYYGKVKMNTSGIIEKRKFDRYSLVRHNVSHQAIFYPKFVFNSFGYEMKYKLYADWYLNYQCLTLNELRVVYVNNVIAYYNETGKSGNCIDEIFMRDQLINIRKYLGILPFVYSCILFGILRPIKNFFR